MDAKCPKCGTQTTLSTDGERGLLCKPCRDRMANDFCKSAIAEIRSFLDGPDADFLNVLPIAMMGALCHGMAASLNDRYRQVKAHEDFVKQKSNCMIFSAAIRNMIAEGQWPMWNNAQLLQHIDCCHYMGFYGQNVLSQDHDPSQG